MPETKQQWVERVLGIRFPQSAAAPFAQLYQDLLRTITVDLQTLRTIDPKATATLASVVQACAALAAKGEFETAYGRLEQAATALAKAMRDARTRDAQASVPVGKVSDMVNLLSAAQDRWNVALDAARARAKSLHDQLAKSNAAEATGLENILESYWDDFSEALREAEAGHGETEARVAGVMSAMNALRAEMERDELFTLLERGGIAVRPAFIETFGAIETMLRA